MTTPASFDPSTSRKGVRLMTEAPRGEPLVVLSGLAARMDERSAGGGGNEGLAAIALSMK